MSGDMSIRQAFVQGMRESTGDFQTKASSRSEVASGVVSKDSQSQSLGKMSSFAQFSGAVAGRILGQNLTSKILSNMDSKTEKKEAEALRNELANVVQDCSVSKSYKNAKSDGWKQAALYDSPQLSAMKEAIKDPKASASELRQVKQLLEAYKLTCTQLPQRFPSGNLEGIFGLNAFEESNAIRDGSEGKTGIQNAIAFLQKRIDTING